MKIEEFVKLSAKEANEKLRKLFKDDKITVKQFKEISGRWLSDKGLIKTDMGWYAQPEIDEQGLWYHEGSRQWLLDTEEITVERKDSHGKIICRRIQVPKKAIEYAKRQKDIIETYNFKNREEVKTITSDLAEAILLGD